MPFDSIVTAAVAHELRERALGAAVSKVYQPRELEIYIHLRRGTARHVLLVSAHPETFRMHLVSETPENPASPPQFCMALRKYLEDARIEAVQQEGLDRIVRIRFASRQDTVILTAELMGKHSNIVLTNASGRIIDCIKHVTPRVSRVRQLLPGRQYQPPPHPAKPSPFGMAEQQLADVLSGVEPSPEGILACFSGISPFGAKEVAARAEAHATSAYAHALWLLLEDVRTARFSPAVLLDDTGRARDCWAFQPRQSGIGRAVSETTISAALEMAYAHIQRSSEIEDLRRQVLSRANEALQRIRRRIAAAQEALSQSERAEEYRIAGELLTANLAAVPRGSAHVELTNYYDPEGKPITVPLDSKLSPAENAARYFERHRKARSAGASAREQLTAAQQDEQAVHSILSRADTDSADALKALLTELGRFVPRQAPPPQPLVSQRKGEHVPKIRRVQTPEGWEILVGETKEANDYLTTKIAAPDDLWFHVRAGASAHVVVRTGKRPNAVPHSVILRAARIAAANSEAKHSSLVPVDYTLRRYVTKPRGSPPGAVLYRNERTIHVEPER